MRLEQIVQHKKLIQSDRLTLVLVVTGLAVCSLMMAYMEQTLHLRTQVQQFVLFFALLYMGYLIINRQLTSFRYVLIPTAFSVYRRVGRREQLVEHVPLRDVEFLSPYAHAPGKHGREYAVCTGKRQQAIVLAHTQKSKLQWLLISPNEEILRALNDYIAAARLQEPE